MLQRRGLVERVPPDDRNVAYYRMNDLAYGYARAQVNGEGQERAIDACLAYIAIYDTPSQENFAALRPEIENFMGAATWAFDEGQYDKVERLVWSLYFGNKILLYQGYYREAANLLKQVVEAAVLQDNRPSEASHLRNLGVAHGNLGQHKQAIVYYQRARTIRREIGDTLGECVDLCKIGNAYFRLGQHEQAINCFQEALTIAQEIGDRRGECHILNNLGSVYLSLRQHEQAIDCFQEALTIARKIGDRRDECHILSNLGTVHTNLGRYSQAINLHNQALAIAREIGIQLDEAHQLNNIGAVHYAQGNYSQAIDLYRQALTILTDIGIQYEIEVVNRNIANAQSILDMHSKDPVPPAED